MTLCVRVTGHSVAASMLRDESRGESISRQESPLQGDVILGELFRRFASFGGVIAIEKPDGIGFEFDSKLSDDVLDGLRSARDCDGPIILARSQLALHEDVRALDQTGGQLCETLPEAKDRVPLSSLFPLSFFVLPGFGCCHRELSDDAAVR